MENLAVLHQVVVVAHGRRRCDWGIRGCDWVGVDATEGSGEEMLSLEI
jgi:hypothetical protein